MKNKVDQLKDQKRPDLPISETLKATTIDPKEIMDPLIGNKNDCRGKKEPFIYKKSYKAVEVACLPRAIPEDDSPQANKIQAQLAILGKLRDSPNILKFYGLSHLDNQMVMVVEWAELGSLREVYNTYDIAWQSKVNNFYLSSNVFVKKRRNENNSFIISLNNRFRLHWIFVVE